MVSSKFLSVAVLKAAKFTALAAAASLVMTALTGCGTSECKSNEDKKSGCVEISRYKDGTVGHEIVWKNYQKNGVEKFYSRNGQLNREVSYKDDKRDGVEKWYHDNGRLLSEHPHKDGKVDGVSKAWHSNGQLKYEMPHKMGKRDGVVKWYNENGELTDECEYKDDELVKEIKGDGYRCN